MTPTPTLLPDRLRLLWDDASAGRISNPDAARTQEEWLAEYAAQWRAALLLPGQSDLEASILTELAEYYRRDVADVRRVCTRTDDRIADAWRASVDESDPKSIDAFYDKVEVELYVHALMWWHTLHDDNSPLAYVCALEFAKSRGCRSLLDFGAGAGSGALLYARSGLATAAADISAPMLAFTRWRLDRRNLSADILDLRTRALPDNAYDFVSAMDVFEHLSDPAKTVDDLARAIRPGGFLYGRFAVEDEDHHPLHIVRDFAPVFARLAHHGFQPVWRDNWLWGHQVFQKHP